MDLQNLRPGSPLPAETSPAAETLPTPKKHTPYKSAGPYKRPSIDRSVPKEPKKEYPRHELGSEAYFRTQREKFLDKPRTWINPVTLKATEASWQPVEFTRFSHAMSTTLDRIFGRATRVSVTASEDLKELVTLFGQINRPTRMSLVQLFEKGELAFYGQQTSTENTLQAGVWLNNRFIGVELKYDR